MYHLKPELLLVAACTAIGTASPAVAFGGNFADNSDDRYIVDPDTPYFMSDADQTYADPHQNFVLRGSLGVAGISGTEHVYFPGGGGGNNNLSLLKWESTAPMASIDAKARFGDAWTLRGHIDAAMSGDSTMTDYDWIPPFSTSLDMNNWSDRSISPNTSLDWYLNGSVAVGRDLPISDALTVNVNGGLQYTDVEWTANGGTYIYSDLAFRDSTGSIPDGPGVRYRQQLPTVFLGTDATVKDGPWSLEASGKAGLVVYGRSTDWHYLRDPPRYQVDYLDYAQVLQADARLGYDFSDHLGAFVEGSYQKMFSGQVPTDYFQMSNNALLIHDDHIGGAELDTWSLKAGLKGQF